MIRPGMRPCRLDAVFAVSLLAFAGYRLAGASVLSLLLAAQAGLVAVLLMIRRGPAREARWPLRWLAWWTALAPLLMRPGSDGALTVTVQVAGLGLALWAKVSLGCSFGIAPADRGLVVAGPYRWLRHPAYAGELISFIGVWLSAPIGWNTGLLALIALGLVLRIMAEENVIGGYSDYAARVRWRLAPGIW